MTNFAKLSRRFSALVLALVMLMTGFVMPAYAQEDWELLTIRLSWTDANGNPQEAYAAPVTWSQDQSYWVQVTADAPLSALMMNISHPNHAYVFDPADGSTLMNVVDAGSLDGMSMVTINAYENDAWANSFNLYVSTQISMPEEPAPEPARARVTIVYKDIFENVLGEESRELVEGDDANNTIYAKQIDGYTISGADSVYVSVTADGASPNPVEFYYAKNLAQVPVQILYKDQNGNVLAENSVTLTEGDDANNTVYAAEMPGYTLTSEGSVFVTVTADGASPNPVEFYYVKNLAQVPVQILYKDQDGNVLAENSVTLTEGDDANNTVYAAEMPGYTLTSEGSVFVTVTADGASPNPVEFYYTKNLATADVTVIHQSDDGLIYEQETLTMTEGGADNTVYAKEYEGYTLSQDSVTSVTVEVTAEGANPSTVSFYYNKILPKQADVLVRHVNAEGEPLAEDVFVTCYEGQENPIQAQQFEGYTLQGDAVVYVTVNSDGSASHAEVVFQYTKDEVPTEAPATEVPVTEPPVTEPPVTEPPVTEPPVTEPPVIEPATASVTVIHQSDDGLIYEQETLTMTEGGADNTVYAKEYEGYTLSQDSVTSVTVEVTAEGANPSTVNFYYNKILPKQADVLVRHVNAEGEPLAEDVFVTCYEGQENPIQAQQLEGYTLQGDAVMYVTVNSDGSASHAEVVFQYTKDEVPTEAPATEVPVTEPPVTEPPVTEPPVTEPPVTEPPVIEPATASVTVIHQSDDGLIYEQETLAMTEGGADNTVYAKEYEGYTLSPESAASVTVEVTAEGANPSTVSFYYNKILPKQADVLVRHVNAEGEPLAEDVFVTCYEGQENPIQAQQFEGYTLQGDAVVYVTVNSDGSASRAEVVFQYTKDEVPTETPAPVVETPIPQGTMINRFGTITKAKTALREGPGKDHGIVTRLAKGTVVYMLREELNESGQSWVRVLVDGETYYISADCLQAMTQAESDSWMASEMSTPVPPFTAGQLDHPDEPTQEPTATPTAEPTATPTTEPTATSTAEPTATPTAAPTEVPAIYTGYALTTTNVAIRSQVNGGDASILRLADVKELVMITAQEFADGSTWSAVTALDGVSGYIPDASLRHINSEEAQYYLDLWNDLHATAIPTEVPTPTPTAAPTEVPAQYAGYALTTGTVALRTEISTADETILQRLEKNELVMVTGQSYANGESWSLSTTLDNISGYIPDSSLRRINNEEAAYYLDLWEQAHPTATPTAAPVTPEPAKISGYAYTVGDDVYFRQQASSMASIIDVLSKDVVVYVRDQDYQSGEAWHVVQYNGQWGYIRADMLRMMTVQEENAYLDSLSTPEPEPEGTIAPPSPDSLSSYGYVSDSSVNFRKEPNTSSSRIRQLKQYAFCLVLGTTEVDGVTWYRINYGGQEGYVHGKYFKQMSMAELEEFLNSDEYTQGIANNSTTGDVNQDFTTGGGIVSAEDQTVDQWTNPNSGIHVSYEPFDPFATVAPVETPVPTGTVTIPVEPTATLEPIPTMDVTYPTGNDEKGGSGILGWVIAVVLIAVIGGGVYVYVTYTNNKRKAAQRAAARRAQAAAQQRSSEARPYARSAQANQPRTGTYPNQAAQRPMSSSAQQVRRPAAPQQSSYTRPAETEQADYTANYRNPNTAETTRPAGRRSAYRAQQTQQNDYTASYRNVEENGDFKQEKDNGDFE